MSGGLFALLDDIAVLAKAAAASVDDVAAAAGRASAKAAGVVVDDTAVTPQYVRGVAAEREIPMIKKITIGSLRNKLLFILPGAMLLSQYAPWLLTPLLMLGASYLCFEGAEKVLHYFQRSASHEDDPLAARDGDLAAPVEDTMVANAIRTDFILSAEIMVISLNEVANEPFVRRLMVMIVVALVITIAVYGVVGLIVKMDDFGLKLIETGKSGVARLGHALVNGMPRLLSVISVVGTIAMLWVGGHIMLVGLDDLGWHWPYGLVHHLELAVQGATGAVGGVLGWLVNTFFSAIAGGIWGAVIVAALHVLPHRHDDRDKVAGVDESSRSDFRGPNWG